MNGSYLTLEPDEDGGSVWLIDSASTTQGKDLVFLREGFGVDEVREALVATGCVKVEGDRLHFTGSGVCLPGRLLLSEVIEEMFGYFKAPGIPTTQLLQVQSTVAEYAAGQDSNLDIPLFAYAWLDIMVREDIADESRMSKDIWTSASIAIELDRARERRVTEFLSQYCQTAKHTVGRMASSLPTRKHNAVREAKTG